MIKITITKPSGTTVCIEIPLDDEIQPAAQPSAVVTPEQRDRPVHGPSARNSEESVCLVETQNQVLETTREGESVGEVGEGIVGGVGEERGEVGEGREGEPEKTSGLDQVEFPTDGDGIFRASPALVTDFVTAFGEEHVKTEFQKAKCWLLTNPTKRKTQRGMGRFLNAWLCRQAGMQKTPIKQIVQKSFNTNGKQDSQGW